FEEKLEETINKYNNNFLSTEEVIEELTKYAEELQEEEKRTERMDMSEEELAFYDALSSKGTKDIEEEDLKDISRELKERLKNNADIDWTDRTQMRSKMKSEVKKVLRSRGFDHTEYEPLIEPIVQQAEVFYRQSSV
ncbi:MAG: type I restriction enzyme endonuclease domain-containing protein, partial [Candidatus Aenigmatarchaeota archaeon]